VVAEDQTVTFLTLTGANATSITHTRAEQQVVGEAEQRDSGQVTGT
jgi:hypothetical protein